MARLNDLLNQIGRGDINAADVSPEVRALCRNRSFAPNLDETMMRMTGVLDERDPTDTFIEVTAARMSGKITAEDYALLYEAVADSPLRVDEGGHQ